MIDNILLKNNMIDELNQYTQSNVPGLQYIAVTANRVLLTHASGCADIQDKRAITLSTTLMAYSMTKIFTSVAILQLAEQGKLNIDNELDLYLPNTVYHGHGITLRQLLIHTSGIPNPIPLRWAHLILEDSNFNEDEELASVLRE